MTIGIALAASQNGPDQELMKRASAWARNDSRSYEILFGPRLPEATYAWTPKVCKNVQKPANRTHKVILLLGPGGRLDRKSLMFRTQGWLVLLLSHLYSS